MIDIDADGDQDIVYIGTVVLVVQFLTLGMVLENLGCNGTLRRSDTLPRGAYNRFDTSGLSTEGLNNDGFDDLVVVAGAGLVRELGFCWDDAHSLVERGVFWTRCGH